MRSNSPTTLSSTAESASPTITVPSATIEVLFVLERQWRKLGHTLDPDDFTDVQTIAAIERITCGNFRLLQRLLPQIQCVPRINESDVITNDVIKAARSNLVIGIN